jgi:hypothetical protein
MRTNPWLSLLVVLGLIACGDDAGNNAAEPDADIEDGGTEPRSDGGRPEPDSGDDPEPDASRDSGDEPEPDAGDPTPVDDAGADAGTDAAVDAGEPALTLGGLTVTVDPEEHELDLFGEPGHRFWFEVSEEQLAALNTGNSGGGGDIYSPGRGSNAFFAHHLLIENVVTGDVADYGKVEIDLVGGSTYRQWTDATIPNVRIDANELDKDTRIGSFEHLRLNNSVVGTIFGEALVHRVFRALGYPALRSSHVFLGGSAWGEEIWVPMTLVEMYKRRFCRDNEDIGSCENMWEFAGDLGGDYGGIGSDVPREWCQVNDCDNTRLVETSHALAEAPRGAGFKEAMDPFISWDHFHRFQCISWILSISDSALQGGNNVVVIERDSDHKLIWAPYSVDISTATEWGGDSPPLTSSNSVAMGCQRDPDCWADTIAACDDLIMAFDELNPEEVVDGLVTTLTDLDMMRYGDEARGERMRSWYAKRQTQLITELEQYRYLPDEDGNCADGMVRCGDGGCGTAEACEDRRCRVGATICESTNGCYYPEYEYCPECTEEAPYFCRLNDSCVADEQVCIDACAEQGEDYVWCELVQECMPSYYCEEYGGGGGMGGMGGIDMGGGIVRPGP